jgi:hypothetical protein
MLCSFSLHANDGKQTKRRKGLTFAEKHADPAAKPAIRFNHGFLGGQGKKALVRST